MILFTETPRAVTAVDYQQLNMASAATHRTIDHDQYICPICAEFFDKPVRTCCNHLFCEECLCSALAINPLCPFCRGSVSPSQYIIANDVLQKMKTKNLDCDICGGQFKPIDGREHEEGCLSAVAPQPTLNTQGTLGANRHVFPCAYCGLTNFSREGLLAHCNKEHAQAANHKLVCTICTAYPWGDKGIVSGNLLQHLNNRHRFDYDLFVDLQEDEENSLHTTLLASTETVRR